jgi:hypothetical protein
MVWRRLDWAHTDGQIEDACEPVAASATAACGPDGYIAAHQL